MPGAGLNAAVRPYGVARSPRVPASPDRQTYDPFWWVPLLCAALPMGLLFLYELFLHAFIRDGCGSRRCPSGVEQWLDASVALSAAAAAAVLFSALPPWRRQLRPVRVVLAVLALLLTAATIPVLFHAYDLLWPDGL